MANRDIALKQLEKLGKGAKGMRLAAEEWKNDWQTLISIILSARTRDETTILVAEKLFSKFRDAKSLAHAKTGEIEKVIKPVNFYRTKAKNIIACSKSIVENFNGKVPHEEEGLLHLPGVGRKTANVFLSENGKDAIGVDTHVSYISQKLGWTKNKNPGKIESDLQELFPRKYWRRINPVLVRFGKSHTSRKEKDELLEKIRNS